MPSYRVHLVGGFVTYLGILQCVKLYDPSLSTIVQGFIFCMLGSLFPDIDIKSKGQKLFYSLLFVVLLLLLYKQQYCGFVVSSFLGIIPILVRHRGVFHHVWFLLLLACVGSFLVQYWCNYFSKVMMYNCWFFFAGTISHVVLDRVVSRLKKYFS
ncbi:metal-dependent hydrolase [Candidatus Babeliales bacterium]|nr:metal-dependent hydrolase [Candidatus Babeliales bacterium]